MSGMTASSRLISSALRPGRARESWAAPVGRRGWRDDLHPDEEAVEGAQAGEAGADGDRGGLPAREADAVGIGEDVLAGDLVGRLAQRTEEVLEHAGVALDGAPGAGASLLLGQEGEGRFPARRRLGGRDGATRRTSSS